MSDKLLHLLTCGEIKLVVNTSNHQAYGQSKRLGSLTITAKSGSAQGKQLNIADSQFCHENKIINSFAVRKLLHSFYIDSLLKLNPFQNVAVILHPSEDMPVFPQN